MYKWGLSTLETLSLCDKNSCFWFEETCNGMILVNVWYKTNTMGWSWCKEWKHLIGLKYILPCIWSIWLLAANSPRHKVICLTIAVNCRPGMWEEIESFINSFCCKVPMLKLWVFYRVGVSCFTYSQMYFILEKEYFYTWQLVPLIIVYSLIAHSQCRLTWST